MSGMIERVSEAIRLKAVERGYPVHPVSARHLAVAAIEAMREPTAQIIEAIDIEDGEWNICNSSAMAAQAWRSGIDAALTDDRLEQARKEG